MAFKKRLMKYIWRVQQAQMVISIIFWSLTLTGVFYPYFRVRLFNDTIGSENVFLGMLILFMLVLGAVVAAGLVYDKLRFWDEQNTIAQERNPYLYYGKMSPKEIFTWRCIADPTPENLGMLRKLIEMNLQEDPDMRAALVEIEARLEARQ